MPEKPDIKHSEKTIQKNLEKRFDSGNIKYTVGNLYLFKDDWETDFLVVQKSGYCYEIEIKISRSDFLNDFKKKNKHLILNEGVYMKKKYRYHADPITKKRISEQYYSPTEWKFRPNKFYYCVPEGLIKAEEVPDYAGLMYVCSYGVVTTIKEAKFLHKEKIELTKKLCDKFYYYWKNTRSSLILLEDKNKLYEAQIKSLKESHI
jgi:hypothetical protein